VSATLGSIAGLELGQPTRVAFGEALRALGTENADIVVVDADVSNSTRTDLFGAAFPDRFFQVGIAESNMVSIASGLAASGHPAVASSFAAFLTCNSYDQIRMSIGFPHADVKLVGSHSGISIGEDGPSQMGIEDIALMTSVPGMTVVVPADAPSCSVLTRLLFDFHGPAYLRTGRPKVPVVYTHGADELVIGRAHVLRDGADVTLIACGLMVAASLEAAVLLAEDGVQARVLDMHTVKPLDAEAVEAAARDTGAIVTAEEHLLDGGLASAVTRAVAQRHPCPVRSVGLDNTYARSGPPFELLEAYGLTAEHIASAARDAMNAKGNARPAE
jgi:transketolase